jgi:hypothetical protein
MEVNEQSTSGATDTNSVSQDQTNDKVSYETYKKVLAEAKSAKEKNKEILSRLETIEKERKEALEQLKGKEEAKLLEQGEFKKILEVRERELSEAKTKLEVEADAKLKAEKDLIDSYKIQAVMAKLPGKIKHRDYLVHIDLDSIAVNPETHAIDDSSLSSVVSNFITNHSGLIDTKSNLRLPSDSPDGSQSLTPDLYKAKTLKDMKKSLPEAVRLAKLKRGVK